MLDRFENNHRVLLQSILEQQCVAHNEDLANALCQALQLVPLKPGDVPIQQDAHDNDIFLILAGRVSIQVNGREMAIRQAGQHVGEMAMIDPAAKRSATVMAVEDTVVAKVSESTFAAIAEDYPVLWRRLAVVLADRLRERRKFVRVPNSRPVIFIGSSAEGRSVANEIQAGLAHDDVVPQVWTNNLFIPGHGTMEDLKDRIVTADYGVLVCTRDDKITNEDRVVDTYAPRDNVILELGMCLGVLGPRRTFLVKPRTRDLKLPSDMLGITPIDYTDDDPTNITAHIGPVCSAIRKIVQQEGLR